MSTLTLKGISLQVAGKTLLGPVDAEILPGQILSIVGRSGTGKSSMLAFLCGVLPAAFSTSGRVLIDGEDLSALPPERRGFGILFQDDLLFPHLSVAGNVAFGLRRAGVPGAGRGPAIETALASFGLAGFGPSDPATLSGGERARVSLLRTLLSEPKALLLDEPFAHLDDETRGSIRTLVFDEIRRRQLPTVLVTHDAEDVVAAQGQVIRLDGPGALP
ncbi:MAG: ATP-binding cassette domain-containing protein [Steroidobacteraceae bacterium]